MLFTFRWRGKALLMVLLLSAAGMNAYAAGDFSATYEGQTLYFKITDETNHYVTITYPGPATTAPSTNDPYTGYVRPTGALSLPSVITHNSIEYTVTAIGDYAFYKCQDLTGSLVIPSTVTSIGKMAFYYCNNTNLNGTLALPEGLLTIGDDAFDYCVNLYQGEASTIAARTLTIPSTVTSIGAGAFYYLWYVYKIVIPNSVTYIGQNAFRNCGNATFTTIPLSVTRIGMHAFTNTYWASQQPDGVLYKDNCLVGWKGTAPTGQLTIPEGTRLICDNAFNTSYSGNGEIALTGNLVLPNSLKYIGIYAFNRCSGLTGDLLIPNQVITIGQDAFDNCTGFNGRIALGRSVQTIGAGAFWNCNKLDGALIIPSTVTSIGGNAFGYCTGIDLIISERYSVPTTQTTSFTNMNTSIPLYVPNGASTSYGNANGWSTFKDNIVSQKRLDYNGDWSVDSKWAGGLPTSSDVVCINASGTLDVDASPLYVYYASNAATKNLTIKSGKTLATTYGVKTFQYTNQLIIEDGGQLVNPFPYTFGTVKREINGYEGEKDNYYFIASPLTNDYNTSTTNSNITYGTYDLYSYDEPTHYWWNAEGSDHGFTELSNGQGYLYANQDTLTLSFIGQFQPSTAEVSVKVTANASSLKGFNLVGNPYTHSISPANLKIGTATVASIYKIEGEEVVIAQNDNAAVMPAEGFFIKTTNGGTLTFNNTGAKSGHISDLNIEVRRANSEKLLDRAYINFYEGENIDKFSISDNSTKLYIHHKGDDLSVLRHTDENETAISFEASENATYTISVKPEYVDLNYLHLIDNLTGVETDLLATPNYTFTAKTTDYASRFRLMFSANNVNENAENDTFAYFNGSEWVINGSDNASFQVIDMMGRVVFSGTNTIATNNMQAGVYVIRLVDGNNVKTQKIVVR